MHKKKTYIPQLAILPSATLLITSAPNIWVWKAVFSLKCLKYKVLIFQNQSARLWFHRPSHHAHPGLSSCHARRLGETCCGSGWTDRMDLCFTSLWKRCMQCSSWTPPPLSLMSSWQMRHSLSSSFCGRAGNHRGNMKSSVVRGRPACDCQIL